MSQHSDHCETLIKMLKKYPENTDIVIDVFYNTITNQEWDDEFIVSMLEFGLSICKNADEKLLELISYHKRFICK